MKWLHFCTNEAITEVLQCGLHCDRCTIIGHYLCKLLTQRQKRVPWRAWSEKGGQNIKWAFSLDAFAVPLKNRFKDVLHDTRDLKQFQGGTTRWSLSLVAYWSFWEWMRPVCKKGVIPIVSIIDWVRRLMYYSRIAGFASNIYIIAEVKRAVYNYL